MVFISTVFSTFLPFSKTGIFERVYSYLAVTSFANPYLFVKKSVPACGFMNSVLLRIEE